MARKIRQRVIAFEFDDKIIFNRSNFMTFINDPNLSSVPKYRFKDYYKQNVSWKRNHRDAFVDSARARLQWEKIVLKCTTLLSQQCTWNFTTYRCIGEVCIVSSVVYYSVRKRWLLACKQINRHRYHECWFLINQLLSSLKHYVLTITVFRGNNLLSSQHFISGHSTLNRMVVDETAHK